VEKAIIKTLIYADIFNYPLKAWEIHKWLISEKGSLRQVEKALRRKDLRFRVKALRGYYFLKGRNKLVKQREVKGYYSEKYLKQAQLITSLFKLVPWVKLVGVSGSLAMENASEKDDIDFFIITDSKRLWISRILLLLILELLGKRRSRTDYKVSGKGCLNLLVDIDSLAQKNQDIFIAHEVLQMKVLWEKEGIYQRFLEENEWVFKFMPNWTSSGIEGEGERRKGEVPAAYPLYANLFDSVEEFVKWLQLRYMGKPSGEERLLAGAVYFHPHDIRKAVLTEYQKKIKKI
jgi:hypothetical protein